MNEQWSTPEHALRQTQRAFQHTMDELRRFAAADVETAEFFARLLNTVAGTLQPVAGAVWLRSSQGPLELETGHRLDAIDELSLPEPATRHARLLDHVTQNNAGLLAPPRFSLDQDEDAGNPTDHLLVLTPLRDHVRTVGVLELFQSPSHPPESERGYLWFLGQVGDAAKEYLTRQSMQELDANRTVWAQFERFAQTVHHSLRRRETAYTIANETRRIVACDRVTVAIYRNAKCRIEAISNQDVFDRRSNVVRQLSLLATRVVKAGEPLWYTGERTNLPPQIEEVLDAFLDESHSRVVVVLPLTKPQPEEDGKPTPEIPVGALVLEQFRDTKLPVGHQARLEVVQRISALALANAVEHESLFLAPLFRAVGKVKVLRHRPWAKIALVVLVALVCTFVFVPADFDLEGRGTLEPVGRHDVFAAIEGVVDEVLVKHAAPVHQNQPLVRLRNVDVEVTLADLTGQSLATAKRLKAVNATLLSAEVTAAERERLHGERAQLLETQSSLQAQLALYQQKAQQLTVRSPMDGKVVTWDVENLLIHRPVERGQMLVSVAKVDGEWELQVRMPEDRMGHIARARADLGEELPVSFILATQPGVTYEGTLAEIHERAEVHQEEGNTVLIKVKIDKTQVPQLRRGATVIAKVHCGRRSLGYVWFHDLWEFVQSRILFRL